MPKSDTLSDFHQFKFGRRPPSQPNNVGHFNVFVLENHINPKRNPITYNRRDFYKICLVHGLFRVQYADKSLEIAGPVLAFFNPNVPYAIDYLCDNPTGFCCVFTDAFLHRHTGLQFQEAPMFTFGGRPFYALSDEQAQSVSSIFGRMLDEMASHYPHKYDLLRNYATELIHYALKIEPAMGLQSPPSANIRLTTRFTELLERQFPIETPDQRFGLRSAADFAGLLCIHVNHLNRAVRETTGRTTTQHIAERLTSEAKALLKHTHWNIAEIAYCLGFDEPAHFNKFFRKHIQTTPSLYRKSQAT